MKKEFAFASSPHIRDKASTQKIMLDVLIALLPALVAGTLIFGLRSLLVASVSVASCMGFEALVRALRHERQTVSDLSAAVTGLLLALTLPASVSYVAIVLGAFFAIVVVKEIFGGLGHNLVNPALGARALLFIFPQQLVRFGAPGAALSLGNTVDVISSATPLHSMQMPALPDATLLDMFLGKIGGCIGEVSALAILIGLAYLLIRRVISWRIPVCFVGTVAVLSLIFARGDASPIMWMSYSVLGGGLLLGAVFMATDYVTSPVSPWGQVLYAVGCGGLTVLIRYFGLYPEGVTYAILAMNFCARGIDRLCAKRQFGRVKGGRA
ncbi:MAG: RnfABCDGE type electron transport complex subunit D [Oscillospiraceae bacterium]